MTWDDYGPLLTDTDLAKVLVLTPRGVRERVRRGLLPQPVMQRPSRWNRDEVKKWSEAGMRPRAMRRTA